MKFKDAIYKIEWHDAQSFCSWQDTDEFKKVTEGRTITTEIGWIVHEDKEVIVICSQINNTSDFGNMTRIPKGMILSRKKIN